MHNKAFAAALTSAAALTLVLTGAGPANAAASGGAQPFRYAECEYPAPDSSVCVSGHGTFNVTQTPSGTTVIVTSSHTTFQVTSPDVGTYTATTSGNSTDVLTPDPVHNVSRFSLRETFSQTGYPDCSVVQNYVYANGQVRHDYDVFDPSCFG